VDVSFATLQGQPGYSGNSSGGTLSVTDGSHTVNIALLGNYLASTFVASSDGHGGTSIIDPPAANQNNPLAPAQHA
jgi:myo-inositol-hexaphosphate 3-phosphohydrolase